MTFLQLHLSELKHHGFIILINFFYSFLVSYIFSDQLIYLLINNLICSDMLKYFICTSITEILVTNVFIAIFISTFISIQVFFVLSWFFIYRGLYQFENFLFIKFYLFFLIFNFFIINGIFKDIIPCIWNFLLNLNFSSSYIVTIYFEPKIDKYFYFILSSFIYIFVVCIYFYSLFFVLINNIINIQIIINLRKLFHLKILILSSLITPPDILNLIILFFVCSLIFEFGICFFLYIDQYRKKNQY